MIATVKETIEILQRTYGNALDETLVVTWWDSKDFEGKDLDDAFNICDDALEICIGHVNDTVGENASVIELCEICESNEKEAPEGKWCTSCKDDFKESD